MSVTSPDKVVDDVLDRLCVEETGLSVSEVWEEIRGKFPRFGAFEKTLVWSWLVQENDLLVYIIISTTKEKSGKTTYKTETVDKNTSLVDLVEKYGEDKLRIGVTDDRQSLFLLGVKKENNNLGYFPYELLRYITKAKEAGITSMELIRQSGQDRRSLTSRLQTLEDLGVVKKFPAVIDSANSYVIVSTKYEKQFSFANLRTSFELMGVVMKSLQDAPNGVRVPSDLARELRLTSKKERRMLAKAIRNLVVLGYACKINVEHESSGRKFVGLQFLKELPKTPAARQELKSELASLSQDREDDQDELFGSVFESNTDEVPTYNPFFPLQNQIFDTVKGNPGISTKKLNTCITGNLSVKSFGNYIGSYVFDTPVSEPNAVIRYLHQEGKARYYCHMIQSEYLKRQGQQVEEPRLEFAKTEENTQTIAEISASHYIDPFPKRVSLVFFPNETFKFCWFGYSGPVLKSLVSKQGKIKQLVIDDTLKIAVSKKIQRIGQPKTIKGGHFDEHKGRIESPAKFVPKVEEYIPQPPLDADIDFGPDKRRSVLLHIIDESKCVALNMDLTKKVSDALNVNYLVDRRTVKKDAAVLQRQNLITVKEVPSSIRSFTHTVLCSVANKPSQDDIDAIAHSVSSKSGSVNPRLSSAPTRPVFKANDSHFFEMPSQRLSQLRKSNQKKGLDTAKRVEARLRAAEKPAESKKKRPRNSNDEDLLAPLMESRKRKKVSTRQKTQSASTAPTKRARNNTRLSSKDVMVLVRAIIISQSLSPANTIDWAKVSALFQDKYTSEVLRRQWPRHKRAIGIRALQLSRKTWERILMSAITNGDIGEEELLDYDLNGMISLWRSVDSDSFENTHDVVLYRNYSENFKEQRWRPDTDLRGLDVFKEGTSIIEREEQCARAMFAYPLVCEEPSLEPTGVQEAKTKLKALFATGPDKFSSAEAKKVFSSTEKDVYSKALTELEDDKVIAYLGEDSPIKFTLTEKIMFLIDWKFTRTFFDQCAGFVEMMETATLNNKGVILSPLSPDSCFAPLINMMAQAEIKVTRIDQSPPMLIDNYSTKSQDKTKLESDFILHDMHTAIDLKSVAPPSGSPCSRLWIDLNGDLNVEIWFKTVCSLLRCIVFRPGVTFRLLCLRFSPLYEPFELKLVLDWMVAKKAVVQRNDSYWAGSYWYLTFDR
ncbi:hypothetical protein KL938_004798 [Ogataea parapolymorpha]|nr:hypothetical protein KL938_004798 [Ogataea parapolymorpha]